MPNNNAYNVYYTKHFESNQEQSIEFQYRSIDNSNSFHSVFLDYTKVLHDESKESICFKLIIVNLLNHTFIESWLPKVVNNYKTRISNSSEFTDNPTRT